MSKQKIGFNTYIISLVIISLLFLSPIIANAEVGVIRGSGNPVVDVMMPNTFRQDYRSDVETLVINVKNTGDSDTFNIVPTSKTGKLIFTPSSASEYIQAGEEKKLNFTISLGGIISYGSSAREDIELRVTPERNADAKVVKTFSMDIFYMPEEQPKTSGFQLIYAILGITLIAILLRKTSCDGSK